MAGTIVEWLAFFLLIILFAGAVLGEMKWLTRKGWATSGKAAGFVLTTDLLGFGIGIIVVVIAFTVMFMMVMGPAGRGGSAPDIAYIIVSAIAFIATPLALFILKRLFLLIFKMQTGKPAWLFSLVAAVLVAVVVGLPPPILVYLAVTLWK